MLTELDEENYDRRDGGEALSFRVVHSHFVSFRLPFSCRATLRVAQVSSRPNSRKHPITALMQS
jgi:hypothetical protein